LLADDLFGQGPFSEACLEKATSAILATTSGAYLTRQRPRTHPRKLAPSGAPQGRKFRPTARADSATYPSKRQPTQQGRGQPRGRRQYQPRSQNKVGTGPRMENPPPFRRGHDTPRGKPLPWAGRKGPLHLRKSSQ
jgi:hypothetical protein